MFSIPVHELIKRPGEMRELVMQFDMDHELGTGYAAVQRGQWLKIDVRLESVHDGILATGEIVTEAHTVCSRCLEDMTVEVVESFQELFVYGLPGEDTFSVNGESIDLEQVVIDSVVPNLPFKSVCSADCKGLCQECGAKLRPSVGHLHQVNFEGPMARLLDPWRSDIGEDRG